MILPFTLAWMELAPHIREFFALDRDKRLFFIRDSDPSAISFFFFLFSFFFEIGQPFLLLYARTHTWLHQTFLFFSFIFSFLFLEINY